MADTKVLTAVKNALGITGEYQDATLKIYIDEVTAYMKAAGVPECIVNSGVSAGVIARGVTDLWNYNGGEGRLSDYFYQRVIQLIFAVSTGKIIFFNAGDYGNTYPVSVEGVMIEPNDTVIFSCGQVMKSYGDVEKNCILISFTKSESETFEVGTYQWSLKLKKDSAVITLINDGMLIVG